MQEIKKFQSCHRFPMTPVETGMGELLNTLVYNRQLSLATATCPYCSKGALKISTYSRYIACFDCKWSLSFDRNLILKMVTVDGYSFKLHDTNKWLTLTQLLNATNLKRLLCKAQDK